MEKVIDLVNRQILIVGASSGIGKETAVRLSRIGAKVILTARREDKLREVASLIEGEGHHFYAIDVNDPESIQRTVARMGEECGPVDGLLYTAGIGGTYPISVLTQEKLLSVMKTNFCGFIEVVRQVCRKKRYNEGMKIVAISSVAASCGDKAHTAYSASKAAIEGAVRCLAIELAEKKININAVAPGMTATEMFNRFAEIRGADSDALNKIYGRQYLGIIQPEQVAKAIIFLLSPASDYITGTVLHVDAGYCSN